MGRKIPAKKHRGVKDPLEQQARRLQVLKTKINAPPKDPDEQPVPRSLTRLFAFQNVDQTKPKRKPTRASASCIDSKNVKNPISGLRKLPGESGRSFSLRINSAVRSLHQSMEPLDYPQDLEEDDVKGERMAAQRARRERKRRRGAARGPAGTARGPPGTARGPPGTARGPPGTARGPPGTARGPPDTAAAAALSRTQRLALKKKEKKLHALQEAEAERRAQPQYERLSFGDVAAAPPALTAPRRAAAASAAPRPVRRPLLLTSLLAGGGAGGGAAEQLRRERARREAVAAYRDIKAQKRRSGKNTITH